MTTSITEIYRQYLRHTISLDAVRDWLALRQWDLPEEEQRLADEADVALAHLDDGYWDEDYVRQRLATALDRNTIQTIALVWKLDDAPLVCLPRSFRTQTAARTRKAKFTAAVA